MASGVVRGAMSAVLEDKKFVQSTRSDKMRLLGRNLLTKVMEVDHEIEFDKFSEEMISSIEAIFTNIPKGMRSQSSKKTRCWSAFHEKRHTDLQKLWQGLLTTLSLENDQLFIQSVNQELFQEMLIRYFSETCSSTAATAQQKTNGFTTDELNAMQYACGYIPHKLSKKYRKRKGMKAEQFVECLGNMAVAVDDVDDDLLTYTRVWLEKVNRGGLFPLNDKTLQFFTTVEEKVRILLPEHIKKNDPSKDVKCVIQDILKDDDVQFFWTIIALDIESEEHSQELLQETVQLWTTIRGFSIASTWLEVYKRATKMTTAKSTGLRKHLS